MKPPRTYRLEHPLGEGRCVGQYDDVLHESQLIDPDFEQNLSAPGGLGRQDWKRPFGEQGALYVRGLAPIEKQRHADRADANDER
jgi:hypothetical protein